MPHHIITLAGKRDSILFDRRSWKLPALALIPLLILPSPPKPAHTARHGIRYWTDKSVNLARYDKSRWQGTAPLLIDQFFLVGFSRAGWFAYTHDRNGNDPLDPKTGEVSLLNIRCAGAGECASDTPSSNGDICYCPESPARRLGRFHIRRLENPRYGTFPARILDDDYDVETVFKEKVFFSEAARLPGDPPGPEFPGTEIYLVSKTRGRQLIQTVDHNHSGIIPESIQIAGWIQSPYEQGIVVVFGGVVNDGGDVSGRYPVRFFPAAANLKTGFNRN